MKDDLIRRGDALEALNKQQHLTKSVMRRVVMQVPAVDAVEVQEWISVKDRLPNPFTPVLVYRQSFGTLPPHIKVDKMTLWNDGAKVWVDEVGSWKNVTTHWMPLPKPPKGE